MKRKTRFNDGGMNRNPFQGDDIDPFSAMRDEEGNIKKGDIPEAEPREAVGRMEGLPTKPQSFKQAFAEAEDGSVFTWNGKSYKKEYAGSAKAPALKDVPGGGGRGTMAGRRAIDDIMRDAGGGGRGRSMGRTAEDEETFTPGKPRRTEAPSKSTGRAEIPVDESMSGPEKRHSFAMDTTDTQRQLANLAMYGAGRAGLLPQRLLGNAKSISSSTRMMPSMMESAKETVKGAASRTGESLKEAGRTVSKTFNPPPKASASAGQASKERAAALKEAEPILQRRPDTKPDRLKRTKKFDDDTRGSEFSKGGSTASRRADGCAVRGKTRGKIY